MRNSVTVSTELNCGAKTAHQREILAKKDKWFVVSYISHLSKYDDRMFISFSNGIDTSVY